MIKFFNNYLESRISSKTEYTWFIYALAYVEICAPAWVGLIVSSKYSEWELTPLLAFFFGCLISSFYAFCMNSIAEKKLNIESKPANTNFLGILSDVIFLNVVIFLLFCAAASAFVVLGLIIIKFVVHPLL